MTRREAEQRIIRRLKAVEAIKAAGGLSRFEEEMLDMACVEFDRHGCDSLPAYYVISCLADAVGVPHHW
jgi:hypothetical protein